MISEERVLELLAERDIIDPGEGTLVHPVLFLNPITMAELRELLFVWLAAKGSRA